MHTKIKVKCIKLTLKYQREQSLRGTREEKGRELKRNVRKGEKKRNNFFFNRLRGHRAGKIFFGEHVVPTKKPRCRKKKIKKIVGGVVAPPITNVAPPLYDYRLLNILFAKYILFPAHLL
jgi:hypothetical protein